jgi:two-component system nitrate/nitrite sensor histidine kinase NarX
MSTGEPYEVKQSLVIRTGLALAGVILSSLVGIIASALTAESVDGDAATINLAGSLRMQAYRIARTILINEPGSVLLVDDINEFHQRLSSPRLHSIANRNTSYELKQAYSGVIERWQEELRPMLLNERVKRQADHPYLYQVDDFVAELDLLVSLIEQGSNAKIRLLRIIQFVCLILTILIVGITLFNLQVNVVNPLKELVVNARRIREGKFASRVNYSGDDELGLLSDGFNQMAERLSRLYGELEKRVEKKTKELSRSNESLMLLYDTSRKLNEEKQQLDQVFMGILRELQKATTIDEIALCLNDSGATAHHCISASQTERPSFCSPPDCHRQFELIKAGGGRQEGGGEKAALLTIYPVVKQNHHFGELVVKRNSEIEIEDWQNQLITTVADIIATSLSFQQQDEQQAHLMLVEERATIARELHDSLAQALSYQKMQVGRLKKAMDNNANRATLDQITEDIREGLNSAYRQLRELLTTFRLKLDAPGLEPALVATLNEFGERSSIRFNYSNELQQVRLTPNEEIHCLQIIREALSNVVRHSQAENAWITLKQRESGQIEVLVDDDGIGLPENPEKINHYGLAIMQERTRSLQGELSLGRRDKNGSRVALVFTPQVLLR